MFKIGDYENLKFFTKDELVDTDVLLQMGYLITKVESPQDSGHQTIYFHHPERAYVLVLVGYVSEKDNEHYTQLIVSRDIVEKIGFKVIHIDGKETSKKASVMVAGRKHLLTAFLPKRTKNIITSYTNLNIIDSMSTRCYSSEIEKKGIVYPHSSQHSISVNRRATLGYGNFEVEIVDKIPNDGKFIDNIKEKGYRCTRFDADYARMKKPFKSELEAWRAITDYEKEFYQDLRLNPFTDYMSQHFDIAYRVLMLEEITILDVVKQVLYEWRTDWYKIVKLNLEDIYECYQIPYLGVLSDADGNMIPDNSNKEEVENFTLE